MARQEAWKANRLPSEPATATWAVRFKKALRPRFVIMGVFIFFISRLKTWGGAHWGREVSMHATRPYQDAFPFQQITNNKTLHVLV